MYKVLGVAVLLATFAFTSGNRSLSASPSQLNVPIIVASGELLNQTEPFTKTLFTPQASGLYRLSAYATLTTATPGSFSNWYYGFWWTDVTGTVQTASPLLGSQDYKLGQFWDGAGSETNPNYYGGVTRTFQVNKGTPITHSMTFGGSVPDGTAYSVFYTLEKLK
jgi:hypothetical protein